jgi:DNA-directed RNA polymerase specialized sigma24 family protein
MTLFAPKYNNLTDRELLRLLEQDNEQAFKTLYNRYIDFLYQAGISRLADEVVIQDMVQEVFVTLFTKRKELGHITELKGWLFACLRNRIINEVRNTRLHHLHSTYDAQLLEKQFEQALNQLSNRSRLVFLLSRKENLSNKSIAEKLQVSLKAVEKHMTSALKIMRQELAGKN